MSAAGLALREKSGEVETGCVEEERSEEEPNEEVLGVDLDEVGEGPEEASDLEREEEAELEHEHEDARVGGVGDHGAREKSEVFPHSLSSRRQALCICFHGRKDVHIKPHHPDKQHVVEEEGLRAEESAERTTIASEESELESEGEVEKKHIENGGESGVDNEGALEMGPAHVVPRILHQLSNCHFSPQGLVES